MTKINELTKFIAGTKAKAQEVNDNFTLLKSSNNNQEERLEALETTIIQKANKDGQLFEGSVLFNSPKDIECETNELILPKTSNSFVVVGLSTIEKIKGWQSGIAIIHFRSTRLLANSNNLQLQDGVDRITSIGDVGIYEISENSAKEISYFSSRSEKTNYFKSQTILSCPVNVMGRPEFVKKHELSLNVIPAMTSNLSTDCEISASTVLDANTLAFKAVRGNNLDANCWMTLGGNLVGWLKIKFLKKIVKATAFAITARNTADTTTMPRHIQLEGSNDDITWELIAEYQDIWEWLQNEKRIFAISDPQEFTYYRITILQNNGNATNTGLGGFELYEARDDYSKTINSNKVKVVFSPSEPLIANIGKGKNANGKLNEVFLNSNEYTLDVANNCYSYIAMKRNQEGKLEPFVAGAMPIYKPGKQRYSTKSLIPKMLNLNTSEEFKYGYKILYSTFSNTTNAFFYPWYAFDKNLATKWQASVVGNNQFIQINVPRYSKIARFQVTASDVPTGCIKNGFIKGWDGIEWKILYTFINEPVWSAYETRFFDATLLADCSKFMLELTEIHNSAVACQICQFDMFAITDCFAISQNQFYNYDTQNLEFTEQEQIYVARVKCEQGLVTQVNSFAQNSEYLTEEIPIAINTLYSFNHNMGMEAENIKITGWIEDRVNAVKMPWCVDSCMDASANFNNFGYFSDECRFEVRTGTALMNYKDRLGVTRAPVNNVLLTIKAERSFD